MKKFITLSLSLLLILGFSSCSKDNEDTPISIAVSVDNVSLLADGTAIAIKATTNGEILRTMIPAAAATWLQSTVDEDGTITFNANANTTLQTRTAVVKVMVGIAPNVVFTTVTVSQVAGEAYILPTTDAHGMTNEAVAIVYTIDTNYDAWTASIPDDVDWLTLTQVDNTLTLTPTANLTVTARTATITIVASPSVEVASTSFEVSQAAGDLTLEVAGTMPVELNDNGDAHELTVTTNASAWTATIQGDVSDWCHATIADNTLTITADAYAVDAIREAKVLVAVEAAGHDDVSKLVTITQQGKVNIVAISVPTAFADSYVYKATFAGDVVAWICKEYVASESAQKVVAYPLVNGVIQLDKALVLADDATAVYLQEGELIATATSGTPSTTAALLLEDKRPGGNHNYKVVKIGDNLWMAENLQAKVYADGSAIDGYTDNDAWTANTTGAWMATSEEAQLLAMDGLFYNGFVLANAGGIAPSDWSVASKVDYTTAKSVLGSGYGSKMKLKNGWTGEDASNLSGFSASATGYFSTATAINGDGTDVYYWTSTSESDWLTGKDVPVTVRLNYKSSGFSASTHANTFGHCIRCVKSLK